MSSFIVKKIVIKINTNGNINRGSGRLLGLVKAKKASPLRYKLTKIAHDLSENFIT
jgi:hypothetical protein